MSYDRRYPMLHPLDRPLPGLSPWDARKCREVGQAVAKRTGTRCYFNAINGNMIWCYGDAPGGGPLGVPFRNRDGSIQHYGSSDVDDMVRYIGLGKMSRKEKDRIGSAKEANEKQDAELAREREKGDMEKEVIKHATFLDRKRRGVGTAVFT